MLVKYLDKNKKMKSLWLTYTAMILFLFVLSSYEGSCFGLRWFTPASEVLLCGHATLASAAVLFHKISNVIFKKWIYHLANSIYYKNILTHSYEPSDW